MKHKVLVYVMPGPTGRPQLPVFKHRDHPGAGVQVPAGRVEAGEAPESAAYREMWEESGLDARAVRLARKLAEAPEPEWQQVRHVYLFEPLSPLPERWTHVVSGKGEDSGMAFDYYWLPVTPALKLAGAQERFLRLAAT